MLPPEVEEPLWVIPALFNMFKKDGTQSSKAWKALFVAVLIILCMSKQVNHPLLPMIWQHGSSATVAFNGIANYDTTHPVVFINSIEEPKLYPHIGIFQPTHAVFASYDAFLVYFQDAWISAQGRYGKPNEQSIDKHCE